MKQKIKFPLFAKETLTDDWVYKFLSPKRLMIKMVVNGRVEVSDFRFSSPSKQTSVSYFFKKVIKREVVYITEQEFENT